jgi:hypothetical protein
MNEQKHVDHTTHRYGCLPTPRPVGPTPQPRRFTRAELEEMKARDREARPK